MKIETAYIALDGKRFTTESECLDYENKLSIPPKSITLVRGNSQELDWNDYDYEEIEEALEDISYIIIQNNGWVEAKNWFDTVASPYYGYNPLDGITPTGRKEDITVLKYEPISHLRHPWINFSDKLNKIKNEYEHVVANRRQ